MARKRFDQMNCSVAQGLEVLGDWWTLLLVREAFFGTTRFKDFERNLGIAKNILAARLEHLVEHGVFRREPLGDEGKRWEYRLTPMGKDLLTLITALREWSDRWIYGEGNEPLVVRDARTGERPPPLRIRDEDGCPIDARRLVPEPGPGADRETRARFRALAEGR
ncbi:MAG: winged helix-turn-helix transcriptional regulator [Myxococcota bacterium]